MFEGNLNKIKKDIFPLSGISNSKTIHCNESGFYSIYQSDRYGFNNPDEEWDNSEIEYLLIGDSFTNCVISGSKNEKKCQGKMIRRMRRSITISSATFYF